MRVRHPDVPGAIFLSPRPIRGRFGLQWHRHSCLCVCMECISPSHRQECLCHPQPDNVIVSLEASAKIE
jgi:hypothetical protein